MKDHLDDESRNAVVAYRLEKSDVSMREADMLAENGFYDSAVTRLYYACYYMASALLISHNLQCNSHAGVKRMLSMHFVLTNIIEQKHIRTFSNLMQGRQLSDYEDFTYQDMESFSIYRQQASLFLQALKPLIKS